MRSVRFAFLAEIRRITWSRARYVWLTTSTLKAALVPISTNLLSLFLVLDQNTPVVQKYRLGLFERDPMLPPVLSVLRFIPLEAQHAYSVTTQ